MTAQLIPFPLSRARGRAGEGADPFRGIRVGDRVRCRRDGAAGEVFGLVHVLRGGLPWQPRLLVQVRGETRSLHPMEVETI